LRVSSREGKVDKEGDEAAGVEEEEDVGIALFTAKGLLLFGALLAADVAVA